MAEYKTTTAMGNRKWWDGAEIDGNVANTPDPVEPEPEKIDLEAAQAFGYGSGPREWELVSTTAIPIGNHSFQLFWTWKRG